MVLHDFFQGGTFLEVSTQAELMVQVFLNCFSTDKKNLKIKAIHDVCQIFPKTFFHEAKHVPLSLPPLLPSSLSPPDPNTIHTHSKRLLNTLRTEDLISQVSG